MVGRRSRSAQAMVEFALVAPVVLLILLILLDFGRGLFYYSQMAAGARESARQATLEANLGSNTVAPAKNPDALPVPGVVPQLQRLAVFGYGVAPYKGSTQQKQLAGTYGTYSGSVRVDSTVLCGWGPGTITLSSTAEVNVLYVFVYELDPCTGNTRWDTGSSPVRTGTHMLAVVDLKMKWAPTAMQYAGLGGANLVFDAQSAQREEW
jgi:hypothetical protein